MAPAPRAPTKRESLRRVGPKFGLNLSRSVWAGNAEEVPLQDRNPAEHQDAPRRWGWWRPALSALGLLLVLGYGYGAVKYFLVDVPGFNARSSAAQQNEQFLASYNMRRTGDIVTIVGKAVPLSYSGTRAPKAFARIDLDDLALTVAISGTQAPICVGDFVAASGRYQYDPQGGTLWISDPENVSRELGSPSSKLDFFLLVFDPNWCGFGGTPN